MRKVLMIGSEILSPFQRTLEEDGYEVVMRAPGETAESDNYPPDVILLDLAAGAEDTEIKRILQEAQTGVGAAVIAVIDPERPPSFDPALGLDDFLATTASPGELTLRLRQALWRRTGVDARNVLRCGDLEM
ncbi:MAG: response regulator transcription factor, partial [Chloroflexi bacterium]|nr:response regulator transcription factor [Chloroflexota bacterium]